VIFVDFSNAILLVFDIMEGMRKLEAYHYAWLESHPHRNEEWLREQLKEGFDIHHIDGDHNNNDPSNLVLIEHTDHMRLHGMNKSMGRIKSTPKKKSPYSISNSEHIILIYNMYYELGTYKAVAAKTGLTVSKVKLMIARYNPPESEESKTVREVVNYFATQRNFRQKLEA
jgi:hypothetical protein